jgi:phosphatidate phosphatase APP1
MREGFLQPRQGRNTVAHGETCPDAFDREPWDKDQGNRSVQPAVAGQKQNNLNFAICHLPFEMPF